MYTFHNLSDADFEELAGDLIGAARNIRLQRFTAGRDSGIDLLSGTRICGSTVVQCKHYLKSGLSTLKRDLRNKELPKICKLNPKRYILATSVTLTPNNKKNLAEILMPYCNGINDIYGADDLNALLREYPNIEAAHYKLWLTSTSVLQRILHQGMAVWNAFTREQIERKASLYVQSRSYTDALAVLEKFHYCVVSGIPGVGKTTLAQILTTTFLDKGFELISVRDDIGEAIQSLDTTKPQIIYYDDFLGRASIGETLGKNEDQGILSLFHAAQRSENLYVILTTREYILRDAQVHYERLSGDSLELAKCLVKMEDYTRVDRARILYNHLYFSDLAPDHISAILEQNRYKEIIDHPNFNPRIVEWLTQTPTISASQTDQYHQLWQSALDNPLNIWEHAFNHQISDDARFILYCLASIVDLFDVDHLREVWTKTVDPLETPVTSYKIKSRFFQALKQLDGSFVSSQTESDKTAIDFHNPSIRDYVTRRLVQDRELLGHLLERSIYFEQLDCLVRLDRNGHVQSHATGLMPDDLQLRQGVLRTFNKNSPSLRPVHYAYKNTSSLYPSSKNLGERLTTLCQWTSTYGEKWIDFICGIFSTDTLVETEYLTPAICGFLHEVIDQHPKLEGKFFDLVKSLCLNLKNSAEQFSVEEWISWSNFVLSHSKLFNEDEMNQIHDDAAIFCDAEVAVLISESDSVEQAESWFQEVEEIGTLWDFDLTREFSLLQESLESIKNKEITISDRHTYGSSSQSVKNREPSDTEIEHLFNMLTDRMSEKTT